MLLGILNKRLHDENYVLEIMSLHKKGDKNIISTKEGQSYVVKIHEHIIKKRLKSVLAETHGGFRLLRSYMI